MEKEVDRKGCKLTLKQLLTRVDKRGSSRERLNRSKVLK
jgi:hypothetical protein